MHTSVKRSKGRKSYFWRYIMVAVLFMGSWSQGATTLCSEFRALRLIA